MNKSRIRVRRSDEQWRELIRELEQSGIDRKTFCQRRGVSMEALRSALRRLARHSAPAAAFVELAPPQRFAASATAGWAVELELGDGVVLRLARR